MSASGPEKVKIRLATTSLAGCFGCHMSFLDIDERLFELAELAEFDRSPLTDIKHCGPCDIALIEGGVCNADNVHVCANCAPTPRSWSPSAPARSTAAFRRCATASTSTTFSTASIATVTDEPCVPNSPELPLALDKVYPLNEIVRVDYSLPGLSAVGRRDLEVPDRSHSRRCRVSTTACCITIRGLAMLNLETAAAAQAAPHRHRAGLPRRGARQGHDPARPGEPRPSGPAAHRRVPRLRGVHRGPARTGKCRSPCSGCAASARSAICSPRPRRWTSSRASGP